MKTTIMAVMLLMIPSIALAWCQAPMLTGNFQFDQARQQAYQNCLDQERFNQQVEQQFEEIRRQNEQLLRQQRQQRPECGRTVTC